MFPISSLPTTSALPADSSRAVLFPWITATLMAGALVVPGAYALLTYWLALYGLWHIRGLADQVWPHPRAAGGQLIWWGMVVYVAVGVAMGLWRGDPAAYFEAYVPMLLAPLIVNAVVVARPPVAMLWLGAAAGAILAGVVSTYQVFVMQVGRAGGAMNNVIMFGDLCVALAMFSAFGGLYWAAARQRVALQALMLAGGLMGLWGSLLSGSKGGWLSILMLAALWAWLAFDRWHWGKRVLVSLGILSGILIVAGLLPFELVVGRVLEGLSAGHTWFTTGKVTDGSVSIRLEKWDQAFDMIAQRPWSGWGTAGAIEELSRRIREAGVSGHWTQTENDLIQAGINQGLLGLLSYLALYLGCIVGFALLRRSGVSCQVQAGLATLGIMLTILMLEFGLSIVVLGRNAFRHFFVTWSMLCLAFILLARHESERDTSSKTVHPFT